MTVLRKVQNYGKEGLFFSSITHPPTQINHTSLLIQTEILKTKHIHALATSKFNTT